MHTLWPQIWGCWRTDAKPLVLDLLNFFHPSVEEPTSGKKYFLHSNEFKLFCCESD